MISSAAWIAFAIAMPGLTVLAGQAQAQARASTGGSAGAWGVAVASPVGAGQQACASPGYCVTPAVGPSVLVARNGTGVWGKPVPIDTTPLGLGSSGSGPESGSASIGRVACPSAGNCSAVGSYESPACFDCLFTVNQRNFVWGKAEPVAGLAQIGDVAGANFQALACSSPGNCVAGGFFVGDDADNTDSPFVVSDRHGTWGNAQLLPGTENSSGGYVGELSCVPGGNSCLADGFDANDSGHGYFVALARNGIWGSAIRLPGVRPLTFIGSIACSRRGSCTVVVPGSGTQSTSTFSESNGKWGPRHRVPGTTGFTLPVLACPSAGNCTIATADPAAIATERDGKWSKPRRVPGLAPGSKAFMSVLACPAEGDCEAGGYITSGKSSQEAFLISERHGVLGKAGIVRGIVKLDEGNASFINSIACASAGHCVAAGFYGGTDTSFLVSQH